MRSFPFLSYRTFSPTHCSFHRLSSSLEVLTNDFVSSRSSSKKPKRKEKERRKKMIKNKKTREELLLWFPLRFPSIKWRPRRQNPNKSKRAIDVNIKIMRAFVSMRRFISKNAEIFYRLDSVEKKQLEFEIKTDHNFEKVFARLLVDE